MLSHFEMKNRPCCRLFYKTPYFIKNLVLLAVMGVILLYVYLVNFRNQKFEVRAVYKILAGLHSHTFNFLEKYHDELQIKDSIHEMKVASIDPVNFYSTCVTHNKPCIL